MSQESPPRAFHGRVPFNFADVLVLLGLAALLSIAMQAALHAPHAVDGPEISLSPSAIPWYAILSTGRMAAAYCLSLAFGLIYGYAAAHSRRAERVLLPILDVLQSIPILSFLPVVLLGLTSILPLGLGVELSAIVLIFTSQVWNLAFSFFQSLRTIPGELVEAASTFHFDPWFRLKTVELPFAARSLIWNSMMSWAGGWFFLMAAETFKVGARDYRLPGLGSYLQAAASAGDVAAVFAGVAGLVFVIVILHQLLWQPILAWSEKFTLGSLGAEDAPRSWVLSLLSRSWILQTVRVRLFEPTMEQLDGWRRRRHASAESRRGGRARAWPGAARGLLLGGGALLVLYGAYSILQVALELGASAWMRVGWGLALTFTRVLAALMIAIAWTVPVGIVIGRSRTLTRVVQPILQVVASIPATALFPVILLGFLELPGGLDTAAVILMLAGTQWYLLFNVIAGSAAIPEDLQHMTDMLRLRGWLRWRTLALPGVFPYLLTGAITAFGGSWNASIVAEHVQFAGKQYQTTGIGALIAEAIDQADYHLLAAATVALVVTVVVLNRTFWRALYRLAEDRYRMD